MVLSPPPQLLNRISLRYRRSWVSIKNPMDCNVAIGSTACCRLRQGLLGHKNFQANSWLERKRSLEQAEIGLLSIVGYLLEKFDLTQLAFGHKVMSMENKRQRMSSPTLNLLDDSSSEWDKNWTSCAFIMKCCRTDDAF